MVKVWNFRHHYPEGRVKIYGVPGPQGGEELGGRRLFSKIKGGEDFFLLQNLKIQDFIFQKKAIFKESNLCDSNVFIGLCYNILSIAQGLSLSRVKCNERPWAILR